MSAAHQTADRIGLGIGLILASVFAMAFADAVIKLVSADVTLWQLFFARSAVAMPILLATMWVAGSRSAVHAPGWVALRSGLLVLAWVSYYSALPVLSLSVAAVAIYTNPIITALLSAALIGERVTMRQWGGVFLGFLGVVAILRPGGDDFSWFVLLPILGAVFYSLAMILTRWKCRSEAPISLSLALHLAFVVSGLVGLLVLWGLNLEGSTRSAFPFLLGGWVQMGLREWAVMGMLGILAAGYFAGVARAYQIAPPSVIATFDYGYLVSAAIWSFVFFAEAPDSMTVLGMVLITGAGVLVARW